MTSFRERPPESFARTRTQAPSRATRARMVAPDARSRNPAAGDPAAGRLPSPSAMVDLREPWSIGPVEIPTRLVLAPMAGVSVQAFRRQGRRFGAGLVCSEMVSCAGIEHRNERTLGYLRVASDEHPLAIQLFGSDPRAMAEAARMVEAAGADIVDLNFGCPVRKVTKTGAGRDAAGGSRLALPRSSRRSPRRSTCPVTVKMRRGLAQRLARLPRRRAAARRRRARRRSTLHPRSAQQMYTGTADHALTAELVVARRRAGDRLRRHRLPRHARRRCSRRPAPRR